MVQYRVQSPGFVVSDNLLTFQVQNSHTYTLLLHSFASSVQDNPYMHILNIVAILRLY